MIYIDELRRKHLHSPLSDAPLEDSQTVSMRTDLKAGTLRALLDELEALRAANQWLPITDAPRDETPVELLTKFGITEAFYSPSEKRETWEGEDDSIGAAWVCCDDQWQIEVEDYYNDGEWSYNDGIATHYRPLPPPPQD